MVGSSGPGIIECFSNGDFAGAFSQLKTEAQAGGTSVANQLDYLAHFTCAFAGINGPQSDFQTSQLIPEYGQWISELDRGKTHILGARTAQHYKGQRKCPQLLHLHCC